MIGITIETYILYVYPKIIITDKARKGKVHKNTNYSTQVIVHNTTQSENNQ